MQKRRRTRHAPSVGTVTFGGGSAALAAFLCLGEAVHAGKPTATWVKDRTWDHAQTLTPLEDSQLRMSLKVPYSPELAGWILSFGAGVQVLRPDSLRQKVLAEARKILGQD